MCVYVHMTLCVCNYSVYSSVILLCLCACVCIFIGSCPATKVFIDNLLAMGRGWVIIK